MIHRKFFPWSFALHPMILCSSSHDPLQFFPRSIAFLPMILCSSSHDPLKFFPRGSTVWSALVYEDRRSVNQSPAHMSYMIHDLAPTPLYGLLSIHKWKANMTTTSDWDGKSRLIDLVCHANISIIFLKTELRILLAGAFCTVSDVLIDKIEYNYRLRVRGYLFWCIRVGGWLARLSD